jgi:hypothetical protein
VDEQQPVDLPEDRPDPRMLADMETVDSALRELGDTGSNLKLRYFHASGPFAGGFVGEFDAPVPETRLQEWYPDGGKFEVRIFVHGEYRDRRYVSIAPPPGVSVAKANGAGPGSEMLQFMRERIASLEADVRATRNSGGGGGSMADIALLMKTMFELQRLPVETPADKMMDAIKLGVELAKGNGESDSWKSILGEVVKEAAPVALAMLNHRPQAGPVPNPEVAQIPAGDAMDEMLKMGIAYLKKKCLSGADAGLYLDLIIDNRDDANYANLIHRALTQEFDVFTAIDGEIGKPPYLDFFRAIYDGLRSAFGGENPVATDSGGGDGNEPNVKPHGKAGKAT